MKVYDGDDVMYYSALSVHALGDRLNSGEHDALEENEHAHLRHWRFRTYGSLDRH